MKPENIMLLGFVDKAAEYLEKQMNENPDMKSDKTGNVDLSLLKEELNRSLESSLGNMRETAEKLLQAGHDAFDKFIVSHEGDSLNEEIDKLFDVDFNEQESEDDIAKLMDYYQLNDEKVDEVPADVEEKKQDESIFEMSDEDKKLLQLISANVNRNSDDQNEHNEVHEEKKNDGIYSNDDNFASIYSRLINEDGEPDLIRFSNPGTSHDNNDVYYGEHSEKKNEDNTDVMDSQQHFFELFNNYVDDSVMLDNVISDKPIEQPDKDDIITLVKDMQESDKQYYEHILQAEPESPVEENIQEEPEHTGFANDLLEDLRKKMIEEDKIKEKFEAEFGSIYEKIHEIYPYLSTDFIRNVYAMKKSITNEFPLDIKVIILHRIHFKTVESLRQFVEIALNHNYSINADENKLIVDVFKQHINTDGKIITSIFEVANQSALLEADYEGYRVLYEEEEKA